MSDTTMTLIEAAQQMVSDSGDVHAAEVLLAQAIESGQLTASVKRWATEQWAGKQLPGNINGRETFIEPADLLAWQQRSRH